MAAHLGFAEQIRATALRSVAANDKQDIDLAPDEIVDGHADVDRTARGIEHGTPFLVDVLDELRRQRNRLGTAPGIKPLVTVGEAQNFAHPVAVVQLQYQRTDHIVEARAQTATGDDAGPRFRRIEEQPLARPGHFKEQFFGRRLVGVHDDGERHSGLVAHEILERRRVFCFAQHGDMHFVTPKKGRLHQSPSIPDPSLDSQT